ncbi:MAG: hypothetical protein MZW92_75745 [Comamonadaceae bacterium]|nr:hypothetical protein [Comamonadaceae bacterium]
MLLGGRKLAGILVELVPDAARPGRGHRHRSQPAPARGFPRATGSRRPTWPRRCCPSRRRADLLAGAAARSNSTAALGSPSAGAGFAALSRVLARRAHACRTCHVRLIGERGGAGGAFAAARRRRRLLLETPAGLRRIVSGDVSLRRDAGH